MEILMSATMKSSLPTMTTDVLYHIHIWHMYVYLHIFEVIFVLDFMLDNFILHIVWRYVIVVIQLFATCKNINLMLLRIPLSFNSIRKLF